MLTFTTQESHNGSHFFITTLQDNLCMLSIQKLDQEELDFGHDYLQNSVYELVVFKVTGNKENCIRLLAPTIKSIYDKFLLEKDESIIYITVPADSPKYRLIKYYLSEETNPNFRVLSFKADGKVIFLFFNEEKTSTVNVIIGFTQYFKLEYNLEFYI